MFRKILKIIGYFITTVIGLALTYFSIAFIFGNIESDNAYDSNAESQVYLRTNGVHLDIILSNENLSEELKVDLPLHGDFTAFGWGDEGFYLHTPNWSDLKFTTAFKALFLPSNTLMHVTDLVSLSKEWKVMKVNANQLERINNYLLNSFKKDQSHKYELKQTGYGSNDFFYRAKGSYSCFKTCNSWVNSCLKDAGLKSVIWTPYDKDILDLY